MAVCSSSCSSDFNAAKVQKIPVTSRTKVVCEETAQLRAEVPNMFNLGSVQVPRWANQENPEPETSRTRGTLYRATRTTPLPRFRRSPGTPAHPHEVDIQIIY